MNESEKPGARHLLEEAKGVAGVIRTGLHPEYPVTAQRQSSMKMAPAETFKRSHWLVLLAAALSLALKIAIALNTYGTNEIGRAHV